MEAKQKELELRKQELELKAKQQEMEIQERKQRLEMEIKERKAMMIKLMQKESQVIPHSESIFKTLLV